MRRIARVGLLALVLGGFVAAAWWVLGIHAAAGKGMPPFSMYSTDRDGLAAAAQLLRRLGLAPVAMTQPVQHRRYRGLLITVLEPRRAVGLAAPDEAINEPDAQALVRWVERGNCLVLAGRTMNAVHHELGVEVVTDDRAGDEEPTAVDLEEGGALTAGINELVVDGRATVRSDAGVPLWMLKDGPGAVLLKRGDGLAVVVADPTLFTLRGLHRADNVRFLYNLAVREAADGRVYFDEFHHGIESGGGFWGYLRHHEQQWALPQVLFAAAVAAWAAGVRLGPAAPRPTVHRADAVDYAASMARIYQRAGVRRLVARVLVRDFLGAVARHLKTRVPRRASDLLAAWRQRVGPEGSARRLREMLRGVQLLAKGRPNERQLLAWARAFDQFKTEVLRADPVRPGRG